MAGGPHDASFWLMLQIIELRLERFRPRGPPGNGWQAMTHAKRPASGRNGACLGASPVRHAAATPESRHAADRPRPAVHRPASRRRLRRRQGCPRREQRRGEPAGGHLGGRPGPLAAPRTPRARAIRRSPSVRIPACGNDCPRGSRSSPTSSSSTKPASRPSTAGSRRAS